MTNDPGSDGLSIRDGEDGLQPARLAGDPKRSYPRHEERLCLPAIPLKRVRESPR
jgi:hypothetical protein